VVLPLHSLLTEQVMRYQW